MAIEDVIAVAANVVVALDVASVGVVVVKHVILKKDMKLQFRKKCQRSK